MPDGSGVTVSDSWIAGPVYVMGSSYEVPFSRTPLSEALQTHVRLIRSYFSL